MAYLDRLGLVRARQKRARSTSKSVQSFDRLNTLTNPKVAEMSLAYKQNWMSEFVSHTLGNEED